MASRKVLPGMCRPSESNFPWQHTRRMRNILMLGDGGDGKKTGWEARWICKGKPKTTKQWELFYFYASECGNF